MKHLMLLRGLPGAGKSTLAEQLITAYLASSQLLSTDQYFVTVDGTYQFDDTQLPHAHAWCQNQCQQAMLAGTERIVVANTLTEEWELMPYYQLAQTNSYQVFSLVVENRHLGQSIHGVSDATLDAMRQRFVVKL